jgi:hypothetical protein
MPLLNFTTEVPVEKSVAELQRILTKHGAQKLMIENDGQGNIVAFSFLIETDRGPTGYKLPIEWERVLAVLKGQKVQPRYQTKEQALRVGWRILKDWTQAQLAIIETRMVTLDQVFLPYATAADGRTLYEAVKASNLLGPPKASPPSA